MRSRGKLICLFLLTAIVLSACRPLVEEEGPEELVVYATFYPIYALSERIFEEIPSMELHCLVQPQDGCLRNYALSDWDLYLLAYSADAVIEGGRGLESFSSTLTAMGESGPAVVTAMLNMELYNNDEETSDSDEETSHLIGPNPHYYLSLEGAEYILEAIALYMSELDPDYSEMYFSNLDAALEEVGTLRETVSALAETTSGKQVVLLNEAAIYPALDMGLEVAEWIDRERGDMLYGDDLENCLDTLTESGARVVLIEQQAPKALIDALENAGFSVAKMDTLSTGREEMGWEGYLQALESNAQSIAQAFEALEGTH